MFYWGNLREINHLEDLGLDGRIILKRMLRTYDVWCGLDRSGSGQGHVAGSGKQVMKHAVA
jgi:hypothetical protein